MIELREITKDFDGFRALTNLSLTVNKGEIYGFIGPNGAGKTTTMRILATLLEPTSGEALVNGHSVTNEPQAVRQFIGFMPDFFGIYEGLTVEEFLIFFAGAFRLPRSKRLQTVNDVLSLTDMGDKRKVVVEALSTGLRQRLCLAKTLLHDPLVLILDEPAAGLDPRGRIGLRELLKTLRTLGKTIFISSHILPELADFCDRVAIIEGGKLIYSGYVSDMSRPDTGMRSIELRYLGDPPLVHQLLDKAGNIQEVKGVESSYASGAEVRITHFRFSGGLEDLSLLVGDLVSHGVKLVGLKEETANLEDLFLSVTKGGVS